MFQELYFDIMGLFHVLSHSAHPLLLPCLFTGVEVNVKCNNCEIKTQFSVFNDYLLPSQRLVHNCTAVMLVRTLPTVPFPVEKVLPKDTSRR